MLSSKIPKEKCEISEEWKDNLLTYDTNHDKNSHVDQDEPQEDGYRFNRNIVDVSVWFLMEEEPRDQNEFQEKFCDESQEVRAADQE